MAQKDNYNSLEVRLALVETLSGATPGTPAAIDHTGYESITYHVSTGTVTDAGAAAGIVWELQDSDDNSSYTAVADDFLIGEESDLSILLDTQDNVYIGKLGYIGNKRYTKLIPTGSAGTDGQVIVHTVLGNPNKSPVS